MTANDRLLLEIKADSEGVLLYRTAVKAARAVTIFGRLPPPPGQAKWTDDNALEIANELWVKGKLLDVLLRATDDRGLQNLLRRTVRNHIIDERRKTARAKLQRRIRKVLQEMGCIESPTGWWRNSTASEDAWNLSPVSLEEAAWATRGVVGLRWRGEQEAVSDDPSLRDLLAAILDAAQCAVDLAELVRIVAMRIGLPPTPGVVPIDVADFATPAQETAGISGVLAREIWMELSPVERILLPFVEAGGRVAVAEAGIEMATSTAQDAIKRLRTKLADALDDLDENEQLEVLALLRSFVTIQTRAALGIQQLPVKRSINTSKAA